MPWYERPENQDRSWRGDRLTLGCAHMELVDLEVSIGLQIRIGEARPCFICPLNEDGSAPMRHVVARDEVSARMKPDQI